MIITFVLINLILESLVVIIVIFDVRNSIPVTFLPFENFPLLFLHAIDLIGISFS